MTRSDWRAIAASAALSILVAAPRVLATGSRHQSGSANTGTLTARLVDPDEKAQERAATVAVQVRGIKLVDPATAKEQPRKGHPRTRGLDGARRSRQVSRETQTAEVT